MDPLDLENPFNSRSRKRTKKLNTSPNHGFTKSGQSKKTSQARNASRETSRGSSMSLEVRCACQYFQCDSLLPDRARPVGTKPTSCTYTIVQNLWYVYWDKKCMDQINYTALFLSV